ncbi:MAG: LacI family DNA-binding transcriptional regulator [Rhodothermales bacterium]
MSQEKSKVTIYDVADHAGVAISTVSRVLNASSDVSEPTRVRVLKAIQELEFRPDRTAKSLAQKATKSFAVAIPTFTMPFHTELLKGIRFRLRNQDIDLLLCDLGSTSPEQTLLNFLSRGAVDGLLLVGVPVEDRLVHELRALHAPVVLVGSVHPDFDSFHWDDRTGATAAIDHLVALGHEHIGVIASHTESTVQDERIDGVETAMKRAGLPFGRTHVFTGQTEKHAGFSEEAGYEAMERILTEAPEITAVFAMSDVQAIGAWKAVRDAGRDVPGDVAIVGYDDIKSSYYIGLSSVDQRMHWVGEEATRLLLMRMEGDDEGKPLDRVIVPELIARSSSAPG